MARKVFISFLGSNNYIPCNYFIEGELDKKIEEVRFVQEAILKLYCFDFSKEDIFLCFNTKLAEEKNWFNGEFFNYNSGKNIQEIGLAERLLGLLASNDFNGKYCSIKIPEGNSSNEIWQIFHIILNHIKEEDEIIFDITHSFRSLPLLGIILLNYARVVKRIQVKQILYGAFEVLGPAGEVRNLSADKRNAPIVNLTSLSELQEWTFAAGDFVNYGKAEGIISLTGDRINPILRKTKGGDEEAQINRAINSQLNDLIGFLETNRGRELTQFDFDKLRTNLSQYKGKLIELYPFSQLIDIIKNKIDQFNPKAEPIWFTSSRWCMEHGMIQQAYTQLQEGVLSWLIKRFYLITQNEYFDEFAERPRNFTSSLLNVVSKGIPTNKWKGELANNPQIADLIISKFELRAISRTYSSLSAMRNDINHGGYTNNIPPDRFKRQFETRVAEIAKFITYPDFELFESKKQRVLVNLTNHPSEDWGREQILAAKNDFEEVLDIPMPKIDPQWNLNELATKADELLQEIITKTSGVPFVVHFHGESTFGFTFINLLKENSIPAIASTTERNVQEHKDGTRTYSFKFVKFRPYF